MRIIGYKTDDVMHYSAIAFSIRLQRFVSSIAQWFAGTLLAATEEDLLRFFGFVFYGREWRRLVRAVTERLFVADAALTPEVDFPAFDFDHVGALLSSYRRVAHFLFSLILPYRLPSIAVYERLLRTWGLYATSPSDGRN